ncbi:CPBP family intramembrane metalloprotease [Chryseobacterium sp. Tr-659]|uniref:CPBP family intramembrane glutamic endopeptidase n=1 Tax=Chryseobacterium sp. Tr-659 TaxID=2608340 RepID=UPI00141F9151|nr:CPBP family intramembrane glutamic endopeptidase [Chryseobacterium sp. Tr-659]NIF05723.1 CPBP family intramembrane metalloprotease [Chryseobacterium sp. Tr-659]
MKGGKNIRILLFVFVVIISLLAQLISITGVLVVMAFCCIVYLYNLFGKSEKYPRYLYHILAAIVFIFSIVIYQHLLPGFHNILIFDKIQVSEDASPFTMYFNIDKALTGMALLLFIVPLGASLKTAFLDAWYLTVMAILLLMGLTLMFNFVKVEYKFHSYFFIWAVNNLLVVTMAEEVLFRGFLQRHLSLLKIKYPEVVGISIAAAAFGALHWQGGIYYMMYAAIAGAMYGIIYQKSKSIVFSIMSHFFLNLVHIIFFTYPFLK